MKKFFLMIILAIFTSVLGYAGIKSIAKITKVDKGVNLHLPPSHNNEYVFAGTLFGYVDASPADFYCIDLNHTLKMNTDYQDVESTSSEVTYILNNYYPYKSLPYNGALSEKYEAASIQLAIWSITDNLDISQCNTSSSIKSRAQEILTDAQQNAHTIQPFKTLVINIPSHSYVIGDTVKFHVEAYNEVGAPIQGVHIHLSVNEGHLSETDVTTDQTGVSGEIKLTAGSNNSTEITATGNVVIPGGTKYYSVSNPDGRQKLVIATPVNASKTVNANVTWSNPVSLTITKTTPTVTVQNGEVVTYYITVKNTGSVDASGVEATDILPSSLKFVSSDGNYDSTSGVWNVGNVAAGDSATLKLTVKAEFGSTGTSTFDLGAASDFNVFVLNDINQPSSDTEGKMAVGKDAELSNYSVGAVLPQGSGDVLVVGRKLTYTSGRVYGNVVFGSFIDTTHWNLADGTIRQDSPIDFNAASNYLTNLSSQIAALDTNGSVTFEYGHLALKGTNQGLNKFSVDGSQLSQCNDFSVDVPSNSIVVINVSGKKISWKGGFELTGVTNNDVLMNFYEADTLHISNIGVNASILAPLATLEFPSGLISGQVVAYNVYGAGQFNNVKFSGVINGEKTITNVAQLTNVNQPSPNIHSTSMARVNAPHSVTGVKDSKSSIPTKMEMMQNYPNPFNPTTTINFAVSHQGFYILKVYNMIGQEVATLAKGNYSPGKYNVTFDASSLNSGVYIYQLSGAGTKIVKKMVLLK